MDIIYEVVVIGGGASGVAALSKLYEKMDNCLLLEAQDHLGGRILTKSHGESFLEYGAHWIHGEDENVVYDIANANDWVEKGLSFEEVNTKNTTFVDIDSSIVEKITASEILESLEDLTEKMKMSTTYKNGYGYLISKQFSELNSWGVLGLKMLEWEGRFQGVVDGTDSWFNPSAIGQTVYEDCPGNLLLKPKTGYHTLIKHFIKNIPESRIRLKSPVKVVRWDTLQSSQWGSPLVEIELFNWEIIKCKHCICTVSLAVLKKNAKVLFKPRLPSRKLLAIENLGIDVVNKIFLEFPHKWWSGNHGFSFLRDHPPQEITSENWENAIVGFVEVVMTERTLVGWLGGECARLMESCSVAEVSARCVGLLRRRLGHLYNIPDPVWCDRSCWSSNPYVGGSYSFRSVASETADVTSADLAAPVYVRGSPVLCFAGEATHHRFYSTVHGAVEAGWREAGRVLASSSEKGDVLSVKVAIIGAGLSGLGAARELESQGIGPVALIEASNRVGGRVLTRFLPEGGFIDLGAQWIHGQRGNSLYEASVGKRLISDNVSVDGEGDFYTEKNELIDPDLVSETRKELAKIMDELSNFEDTGSNPPQSVGQFLSSRFEEYLKSKYDGKPPSVELDAEKALQEAIYGWYLRWELVDNACDSLCALSAERWADYGVCEGHFNLNPRTGMAAVVQSLKDELKTSKIILDSEVTSIEYSNEVVIDSNGHAKKTDGSMPISLKCRNGLVLTCEHVFVTCSLGYLQKHSRSLFTPSLPQRVQEAISHIGYGVIDKIFLEFSEPFWPPTFTGYHLVWTDQPRDDFKEKDSHRVSSTDKENTMADSWYRSITSFDPVAGHKATLCGWVSNPGAVYMESLTIGEVRDACLGLLRRFVGEHVPEPLRVYRSLWATDDFALGAYSHRINSGDRGSNPVSLLTEPICGLGRAPGGPHGQPIEVPLISFAGEALSHRFYSTLHGALDSGRDQANKYANFVKAIRRQ